MLEGLTVAYVVAVALGAAASYRVYNKQLYNLFTCKTIQRQAWAGGIFQLLLFVIGSIVLWQPDYRNTAPQAVKVYIGALIAYYCVWAFFVHSADPKPRPLPQAFEQLLDVAPVSDNTVNNGDEDPLKRARSILLGIVLPVLLWCASQVTALVAVFIIGSKFDVVPADLYFVLASQILYTVYTLSWDGYIYVHTVLIRESNAVRYAYGKICRYIVFSATVLNIILHIVLRYTYYESPPIADCNQNKWQCPSHQPASINAKVAEYYATHGHNYIRAATTSHILNFSTAGIYFLALCAVYRKDWIVANYVACVVTAMFLGFTAKIMTQRERPAVHYNLTNVTELEHKDTRDYYNSFFSADAALAFAAASFVALHILGNKQSAVNIAVALTVIAVAAIGSWLRIVAMMHYVADVATGAGVGLLLALVFSGSALR